MVSTNEQVDTMEETKRIVRRMHTPELKRAVLAECRAGTSVASVAMAFGINANLVHKWRRLAQREVVATGPAPTPRMPTPTFNPLVIGAPTTSRPTDPIPQEQLQEVRIELRGGAFAATVTWPMSANAECAGWLRKLLR